MTKNDYIYLSVYECVPYARIDRGQFHIQHLKVVWHLSSLATENGLHVHIYHKETHSYPEKTKSDQNWSQSDPKHGLYWPYHEGPCVLLDFM